MTPDVNVETGESVDVLQWGLNYQNDDEYNRHLANVAKMIVTKGRTKVARWGPRTTGARHDYHDCEAYQIALAIGMNLCASLPSLVQLRQMNVPPPPSKVIKAGVKSPHGGSFFANKR